MKSLVNDNYYQQRFETKFSKEEQVSEYMSPAEVDRFAQITKIQVELVEITRAMWVMVHRRNTYTDINGHDPGFMAVAMKLDELNFKLKKLLE